MLRKARTTLQTTAIPTIEAETQTVGTVVAAVVAGVAAGVAVAAARREQEAE